MGTVLSNIERSTFGAPTQEEIEHDDKAREHFLKYCDTGKCIRGREHVLKANWHLNGFCQECCYNPYNMSQK